jgi:hypothetical protein
MNLRYVCFRRVPLPALTLYQVNACMLLHRPGAVAHLAGSPTNALLETQCRLLRHDIVAPLALAVQRFQDERVKGAAVIWGAVPVVAPICTWCTLADACNPPRGTHVHLAGALAWRWLSPGHSFIVQVYGNLCAVQWESWDRQTAA